MNDTKEQVKLNPSGFKDSIGQTEIVIVDVTKMTPQNPPSILEDKIV